MVRGIASAVGGDDGLTPTQASILGAIATLHLRRRHAGRRAGTASSASELAAALDPVLARGAVRGMVTLEIVAEPVPAEARGAGRQLREGARGRRARCCRWRATTRKGAMDVAQQDYLRSSYVLDYYTQHGNDGSLHRTVREPGDRSPLDPALEAKWKTLESCPTGSLGRHGVGLLPTPRVLAARVARLGRPAARAARLRALRRRLRNVGHRRDRGVLVHRRDRSPTPAASATWS